MRDLRMVLDNIDFAQLAKRGRSMIPGYAPDWTDHNTHDPGIMLMELLAWVADAQVYALSRTSRAERQAYAGLLGVRLRGPIPAGGLIWPPDTSASAAAAPPNWAVGKIIGTDEPITADYPDAPVFFVTRPIQLSSARLLGLETQSANGTTIADWTRINSKDGATFRPFASTPAKGDRLVLKLKGALVSTGTNVEVPIVIGVETAATAGANVPPGDHDGDIRTTPVRLLVAIKDSAGERTVRLDDTTNGLLQSGVLFLHVTAGIAPVDDEFSITIRSASSVFLKPPHLQRVALNVLPVQQLESAFDERGDFGNGQPDQSYTLQKPGLVFPLDEESFELTISESGGFEKWSCVADLQASGPNDRVFRLDPVVGAVNFGNGVNGAVPAKGATLQVTYKVSQGARGNLPKSLEWRVSGIAGIYGTNSEAMSGGGDRRGLHELQSIAQQRARKERPYVTSVDLVEAALSFSDLEVKRAYELMPDGMPGRYARGTRILVSVGPHDDEADEAESPDWLAEIRARLAPHLPLGQRLEVIVPRYVEMGITARLVAAPNLNPKLVQEAAEARLRAALAIVAQDPSGEGWRFGRDVTPLSVRGWLRNVEGVARVVEVRLSQAGRDTAGKPVRLGPIGLPRLLLSAGDITVDRWPGKVKR